MKDVQNQPDTRGIPINQVGVSDLRYPIIVLDRAHREQQTVARLKLTVDLPHNYKGTHMSRFIEVLNQHRGKMTMWTMPDLLHDLRQRFEAESARAEVRFPYFIEKAAPVTGARALMDYDCAFIGQTSAGKDDFVLVVEVPVTSLCPCSKEISDYGAHNQRGKIIMEIRHTEDATGKPHMVWIEELVEYAEASASAPVYALLKRPDERHVTMQAYDNPVFVEDMVRNVAQKLMADERIAWFRVQAINYESIHNHNAFACIEWQRPR